MVERKNNEDRCTLLCELLAEVTASYLTPEEKKDLINKIEKLVDGAAEAGDSNYCAIYLAFKQFVMDKT